MGGGQKGRAGEGGEGAGQCSRLIGSWCCGVALTAALYVLGDTLTAVIAQQGAVCQELLWEELAYSLPHTPHHSWCPLSPFSPAAHTYTCSALLCCPAVLCVPPDAHDVTSEDLQNDSECDPPAFVDATTSIKDFDLEAPSTAKSDHHTCDTCKSSSSPGDSDKGAPLLSRVHQTAEVADSSGGAGRTLQALLSWRQRGSQGGLREPLLVSIDERPGASGTGQATQTDSVEYEANSSGETVIQGMTHLTAPAAAAAGQVGKPGAGAAAAEASVLDRQGSGPAAAVNEGHPQGVLPAPAFNRLQDHPTDSTQSAAAKPQGTGNALQSPGRGFLAVGRRSFSEGMRHSGSGGGSSGRTPHAAGGDERGDSRLWGVTSPMGPDGLVVSGVGLGGGSLTSPRISHPSGVTYLLSGDESSADRGVVLVLPPSPLTPRRCAGDPAGWVQGDGVVCSTPLSPHLQQLHQQHFAEQVELLEQQAAEHDALLAAHEDQQGDLKAGGPSLKHRVQQPFVQVLSCTMPRVSAGSPGDSG